MTADIDAVARAITRADRVIALTGAGISTASGIPDFRSEGGIWDQYDPAEFHYSRFKAEPGPFWEKRLEMYDAVYGEDVAPNAAHEALAEMESAGLLDAVITQNIDGLHAEAGSESVIEVHGNGRRVACEGCGRRLDLDPVRERVESGELPPRCESCSGVLKPDVVLFGEQLPVGALQGAKRNAREADVFLAVGSSLTVEPVASLPRIAERNGATLVIVNLEETPVSGLAAFDVRADVTEALPSLAGALA
ncbi:MAG: SIR2 family NAD-dependent protein deacylase [Natrialbaceae archaeon]